MRLMGEELAFWFVVALVAISAVAFTKVIAAQTWAPEGLTKLAGHL